MTRLSHWIAVLRAWRSLLTVLCLISMGATPASAKLFGTNYVRMDVVDGWWVWKSTDGICGTELTTNDGTTFSVALFDQNLDQMVLAVSNNSWRSMQIGQRYPFVLTVNKVSQRLDGIAINGAGSPGDPTLVARIDRKSGVDALARSHRFSVALADTELVRNAQVPPRAVYWIITCATGSSDPFRGR